MPIFPPKSDKTRDPRDKKQANGKIFNPVRYPEIGGLSGPGKIKKNIFPVEKPMKGGKG